MLCDNGSKYLSRLFNREWLTQKGLLEAAGLSRESRRHRLIGQARRSPSVGSVRGRNVTGTLDRPAGGR